MKAIAAFEQLQLEHAELRELRILPGKYAALVLLVLPDDHEAERVVRVVELRFDNLHDFVVDVRADPWIEVASCKNVRESDLLQKQVPKALLEGLEPTSLDVLAHFEIVFDKGRLDVIAETYTLTTLETLPVQDGPGCRR